MTPIYSRPTKLDKVPDTSNYGAENRRLDTLSNSRSILNRSKDTAWLRFKDTGFSFPPGAVSPPPSPPRPRPR